MSEKAKNGLQAIGKQLGGDSSVAAIKTMAGESNGPRAQGKVVIITGNVRPLPWVDSQLFALGGGLP